MKKIVSWTLAVLAFSAILLTGCEDDPIISAPDDGSDEGGSYSKIHFHDTSSDSSSSESEPRNSNSHNNPELF